ncbi:MAG TPA: hypothetical protein VGL53_07245 [Bryobacteraceae bacterium]|jgi:hypothetical protein
MTTIPLIGNIAPLANGVRRGQLKRMSSDFSYYGCNTLTLWLTSGEGFRLTSCMRNLADSIEVGILKVEFVVHPLKDEASVDLPWSFRNGGSISKLVIEQRGFRAESGLLLRSGEGDEIVIVSAAFPYHLCVSGVDTPPQEVTTEYSFSRYIQEPI